MELASALSELSLRKKLRKSQEKAVQGYLNFEGKHYNVRMPTGCGKTFLNCLVYSLRKHAGTATRLLIIFPTDKQLTQFVNDGPGELRDAGVEGPLSVVDIRFYGIEATRKHRSDAAQVFVTTIQALIQSKTMELVGRLMATGRWMVTVDEYHHYGL